MYTFFKKYLFRIIILIILVIALPILGAINNRTLPTWVQVQSSNSIVNVTTTLTNNTFSTNDTLKQFKDSLLLKITPSGGIDLNRTAIDYMVILDTSGSMNNVIGGGGTEWQYATDWINHFVPTLRAMDRLSLITFGNTATLQFPFISSSKSAYASTALANTSPAASSFGNDSGAINMAISEYTAYSTPSTPKMIYLFTDGAYNTGYDPCVLATQFKALNEKTYLNTLGVWDGSNDACLLDNSTTDIINAYLYNAATVQNNLYNFGNLTATNISLHLDMNKNLNFNYSYNPDSSTVTTTANTSIWNYNQLRVYYYEKHLNFSINFNVSGIGTTPIYYNTSYLTYTTANNTGITMNLSELDVKIVNPDATTSNSTTSKSASNSPTTSKPSSGLPYSGSSSTSSKGLLDAQPFLEILDMLAIITFWRRKRNR